MVIKLPTFTGEVPKLPSQLLPDNAAEFALNCDFLHGELRGHHDWTLKSALPLYQGSTIVSVWTENGNDFFGWPYEVAAVKSPVINDPHHRIYYSAVPITGPVLKLARTRVINGPQIINAIVPNFFPPESQDGFTNELASWLLGVPAPKAQAVSAEDLPVLSLYDLPSWPLMPKLALRVTYFLEDPSGAIVWESDITNVEAAIGPGNGVTYPQVFYTNDSSLRGNKMQDMLWPLGYQPRPYKFYWFDPPSTASVTLTRSVTITNTDPSSRAFVISYGDTTTTPPGGDPGGGGGGGGGNEA